MIRRSDDTFSLMSTLPLHPDDPPNPPDVTIEAVLGAQTGNPPILPLEEGDEEIAPVETDEEPLDLPPGALPAS